MFHREGVLLWLSRGKDFEAIRRGAGGWARRASGLAIKSQALD